MNTDLPSCSSMLKQTIRSFDGRALNVFHSAPSGALKDLVLVLPFGVRYQIAEKLYRALAGRFNVITWESRFVLDLDEDAPGASIEADMHVRDLEHVIRHCSATRAAGDAGPAPAADVIGYCSGAGVAMLAAARYPGSIRRLALVSGEYVLPAALCKQSGFQREVDVILPAAASNRDSAGKLFEKISAGRRGRQSEFHDFISLPFSSAEYLYRYGMNYVAYRKVDFLQTASEVLQPTLLMVARDDQQVTSESTAIIFGQLPTAVDTLTVDGDHYELCRGNQSMVSRLTQFLLN